VHAKEANQEFDELGVGREVIGPFLARRLEQVRALGNLLTRHLDLVSDQEASQEQWQVEELGR
jgi:hypothetical protein